MPVSGSDNPPGFAEALSSVRALPAAGSGTPTVDIELRRTVDGQNRAPRWLRYWRVYAFVCLIVMSASMRLVNLGEAPPFLDEDNYSSFAQSVSRLTWQQSIFRPDMVTSLTSDKPPLAIVLQARLNFVVHDLVTSGRLLSAVTGITTTMLCFMLGRRLSGTGVGLVSMAAYAVSPWAVLHERMVLQDPLMSAFSLAAVLVAWTALERGSLVLAGLSAVLGALAVQLKVSGLVTAPLMLALMLAVDKRHLGNWYLAVIGASGVVLSYVLLVIGPGGPSLQGQNQTLLSPLRFVGDNVVVLGDAVAAYFPWGLGLVGLAGAIVVVRLRLRGGRVCILGVLAWVIPWVVLSRFAPSRYYLAADPYVCALIALGSVWIVTQAGKMGPASHAAAGCGAALMFAGCAVTSAQYATDFVSARLSPLDDCQYRSCWPSGYAYRAAQEYVNSRVPVGSSVAYMVDEEHRIALGLERPPPPGIRSLGIEPRGAALPVDSEQHLYVVVDDERGADQGSGLRALQAAYPQLALSAQFLQPGSTAGVSIVSTP